MSFDASPWINDMNAYFSNKRKKEFLINAEQNAWDYKTAWHEAAKENLTGDPDIQQLLAEKRNERDSKRLVELDSMDPIYRQNQNSQRSQPSQPVEPTQPDPMGVSTERPPIATRQHGIIRETSQGPVLDRPKENGVSADLMDALDGLPVAKNNVPMEQPVPVQQTYNNMPARESEFTTEDPYDVMERLTIDNLQRMREEVKAGVLSASAYHEALTKEKEHLNKIKSSKAEVERKRELDNIDAEKERRRLAAEDVISGGKSGHSIYKNDEEVNYEPYAIRSDPAGYSVDPEFNAKTINYTGTGRGRTSSSSSSSSGSRNAYGLRASDNLLKEYDKMSDNSKTLQSDGEPIDSTLFNNARMGARTAWVAMRLQDKNGGPENYPDATAREDARTSIELESVLGSIVNDKTRTGSEIGGGIVRSYGVDDLKMYDSFLKKLPKDIYDQVIDLYNRGYSLEKQYEIIKKTNGTE